MGQSGAVVNIHMRTGAKEPAETARTIHLRYQKETIHMISWLLKAACSGGIHDLARIPTENCLADWLTEGISEGRQLDHSGEYREIIRC